MSDQRACSFFSSFCSLPYTMVYARQYFTFCRPLDTGIPRWLVRKEAPPKVMPPPFPPKLPILFFVFSAASSSSMPTLPRRSAAGGSATEPDRFDVDVGAPSFFGLLGGSFFATIDGFLGIAPAAESPPAKRPWMLSETAFSCAFSFSIWRCSSAERLVSAMAEVRAATVAKLA